MEIDHNHILQPVIYIPSPNFDVRPAETEMSLLVIHNISLPPASFSGSAIINFFCNRLDFSSHPYFATIAGLRVSSHLLIRRDGLIIQFVPFHYRAWHAGQSTFNGKNACNDFSIGIELEGTDDMPYNLEQYAALRRVVEVLLRHYPKMTPKNIVGHCDISPGRKTDPGPSFDWDYFKQLLSC